MADNNILSQDEVDALLKAVETGEVTIKKQDGPKKCVKYDFKSPKLFSRENRELLATIHDEVARRLSSAFAGYLRLPVEVKLISTDQLTYNEFVLSLPKFPCISVISFPPLKGSALMEININILFLFIERLLGGGTGRVKDLRPLTDLERAVARKISEKVLDEYRGVWAGNVEFSPRIDAFETDSRFIQAAKDEDSVVLACFEIKFGGDSGILNICFPPQIFESLLARVQCMQPEAVRREREERIASALRGRLLELPYPVSVIMAKTCITAREASVLRPGDMIRFAKAADASVVFRVGSRDIFTGSSGVRAKRFAAVIQGKVE